MKNYNYSARTVDGAVKRGSMEAENRTDVVKTLQDQGLIVVGVEEKVAILDTLKQMNLGGVPIDEQVIFMRQLATMISSGLPLTQALEILANQARNPLFKRVLEEVLHSVEGGKGLAESFKKFPTVFDEIVLNLIKAGEDSGKLEEICLRLADELEHRRDFQSKVKSAMIYPAIILVTIVAVIALVVIFMVPAVKDIYGEFGGKLPLVTQILIGLSDAVWKYWWLFIIVIGIGIAGLKYYIDTPKGRKVFHALQLKVPVIGPLNVKIQLSQFTQTLHLLIASGIPILDALDLVSASLSNVWFKEGVKTASKEVEKGSSLALPLSRNEYFPLIVSQMIGVGEETGKLDEVLNKMAEYYGNEVKIITNSISTLIEPIILVVMGVVVAFVAISVYMPLFSLASLIK